MCRNGSGLQMYQKRIAAPRKYMYIHWSCHPYMYIHMYSTCTCSYVRTCTCTAVAFTKDDVDVTTNYVQIACDGVMKGDLPVVVHL